jgi:hypothetical protein
MRHYPVSHAVAARPHPVIFGVIFTKLGAVHREVITAIMNVTSKWGPQESNLQ